MKVDVQAIANRLHAECFEAHRGAFWWDEQSRCAIAFGNDGYSQDERSQREVALLREVYTAAGGQELGFATAGEGYTWAAAWLLPPEPKPLPITPGNLESTLWTGWLGHRFTGEATASMNVQQHIAGMVLERCGLV
jgi:hypothetical protein